MRVFVYEYVIGGGLRVAAPGLSDAKVLLGEAVAIAVAVASDFAALPGTTVCGLRDAELRDLPPPLDRFRAFQGSRVWGDRLLEGWAESDAVLLIAPETGRVLPRLAADAERLGAELISPSSPFCEWAGDKSRVADTLQAAGVPMPRGVLLRPDDPWPSKFPLPAVLKPNDGCGSLGITLLPAGEGGRRPDEGRLGIATTLHVQASLTPALSRREREFRLEQYVLGVAASVAMLRGPAGLFPLPACSQRLADDGTFTYLGGRCPLPEPLAARADALARRAAAAMPAWCGYVGVDLVLGAADDGSQDYVIEVNPRLTTSYVGLRTLSETNLAKAMLDVVAGREPELAWRDEIVEFDADGTVRSPSPPAPLPASRGEGGPNRCKQGRG